MPSVKSYGSVKSVVPLFMQVKFSVRFTAVEVLYMQSVSYMLIRLTKLSERRVLPLYLRCSPLVSDEFHHGLVIPYKWHIYL